MATDSAQAVTQFFGEVVAELAHGLSHLDVGDEATWELSRRLHSIWRETIRRSRVRDSEDIPVPEGHPAFTELKRLVDVEVQE